MPQPISSLATRWASYLDLDAPFDQQLQTNVVLVSFLKPPDLQWSFILAVADALRDTPGLYYLAAGPLESLLSKHGEDWITHLEIAAERSARIRFMTALCQRQAMSEDVWHRLQHIPSDQDREAAQSGYIQDAHDFRLDMERKARSYLIRIRNQRKTGGTSKA